MMEQYAFTTIRETSKFIEQQRVDDRIKREFEKRKIREFKKMAQKRKIEDTKKIMQHLLWNVRPFLLQDSNFELMDDLADRSEYILKSLCDYTGIQRPCKGSTNTFDKFILSICDKFAIWMTQLLHAARVSMNQEIREQLKQEGPAECAPPIESEDHMVPIDDYIQWFDEGEDEGVTLIQNPKSKAETP